MKPYHLFLLVIIILIFGCGDKKYKQSKYSDIKFEYKKTELEFTNLKSNIEVQERWLNGKPAGRLAILFSIKNKSNKAVELNKSDFKVFLPSSDTYYPGDLSRTLDDIDKDNLTETQENIIMPGKEANFESIYWFPYSNKNEYYDDIKWNIQNGSDNIIVIFLEPKFGIANY